MVELGLLLVGAGVLALAVLASQAGAMEERPPQGDSPATAPEPELGGQSLPVYLTSYWPFQAGLSSVERRMEGGVKDRRGNPLYTLEAHKAGSAPYVSLAGDFHVFPYGQRLLVDDLGSRDDGSDVVARVVDTGGHFFGPGKVVRLPGHEPVDVCVENSRSAAKYGFGGAAQAVVVEGDTL